jgi:hypothetical protein
VTTPEKISPWRRERLEKTHRLGRTKFILYWSVLPFTSVFTVAAIFLILIKGTVLSVPGTILILTLLAVLTAVFATGFGWVLWRTVDANYAATIAETSGQPAAAVEASAAKKAKADQTWLILLACSLVGKFLFALFPDKEAPSSSLRTMTIVIDVAMTVALIGYGVRVLRAPKSAKGGWSLVIGIGVLAAFGLFVMQGTGGMPITLPKRVEPPRPVDAQIKKDVDDLVQSTEPFRQMMRELDAMKKDSENQMNSVRLRGHLQSQIDQVKTSWDDLQHTKWIQTAAPERARKLTRENVRDYQKRLSEVSLAIDRLAAALAATRDVPVPDSETQYWQWAHDGCKLRQEQANLVITNWNAWHSRGLRPQHGEQGAWQAEFNRLDNEVEALTQKQMSAPTKFYP